MQYRHNMDNKGRYKLQWFFAPKRYNPDITYYHYWLFFSLKEDAIWHYETFIKDQNPFYPQWEIVDTQGELSSPKA
jgi:hypothetical protein